MLVQMRKMRLCLVTSLRLHSCGTDTGFESTRPHPLSFSSYISSSYFPHPTPSIRGPGCDRLTTHDFQNTPGVFLLLCFFLTPILWPGMFTQCCPDPPPKHFHPFSPPGLVQILLILQSCNASSDSWNLGDFLCSQRALLLSCVTRCHAHRTR